MGYQLDSMQFFGSAFCRFVIWLYFFIRFGISLSKYLNILLKHNTPEQIPAITAIPIIIPPITDEFEIDEIKNTGDAIIMKTILKTISEIKNAKEPINIFID